MVWVHTDGKIFGLTLSVPLEVQLSLSFSLSWGGDLNAITAAHFAIIKFWSNTGKRKWEREGGGRFCLLDGRSSLGKQRATARGLGLFLSPLTSGGAPTQFGGMGSAQKKNRSAWNCLKIFLAATDGSSLDSWMIIIGRENSKKVNFWEMPKPDKNLLRMPSVDALDAPPFCF